MSKKFKSIGFALVGALAFAGVAMGATAAAKPDGYTVGMLTFQLSAYGPMGMADLSYRDYDLIQLLNQSPGGISVAMDAPWQTLEELLAYTKENPGVVTVGHSGTGGSWHLGIAAVATANGAEFNYVPFNGTANVTTALLGGHIAVAATGIDEMQQLQQAGKVRILAVSSGKRATGSADVPTVGEAGFPVTTRSWTGAVLAHPRACLRTVWKN